MLIKTFLHLAGFTKKREKELWDKGVRNWTLFNRLKERHIHSLGFKPQIYNKYRDFIKKSQSNLRVKNHLFFSNFLPKEETWRLYPEFSKDTCFMNVLTSGRCASQHDIGMITVSSNKKVTNFVQGQNLDEKHLKKELSKYKVVVTFDGSKFDMPFIQNKFPKIKIDHIQLELRKLYSKIHKENIYQIKHQINSQLGMEINDHKAMQMVSKWKKNDDNILLNKLKNYSRINNLSMNYLLNNIYKTLSRRALAN